jgi:hypothetical protein
MPAAIAMAHARDPAEELREAAGDLSNVEVYNNQVLVGIYVRPEKTKSGLYTGVAAQREDEYQGKAMLILKMGANAFTDPAGRWFQAGNNPKVGDWIVARPGDTWQLTLNKAKCRMMNDTAVRLKIPAPDVIW